MRELFANELNRWHFEFHFLQAQRRGSAAELKVDKREKCRWVRFGTIYGGWWVVDDGHLENTILVSAGLGEDASFDVEYITRYAARAVLVDPTPRSVLHYEEMRSRFGKNRTERYAGNGAEAAAAYDLSRVSETQLTLCKKALWNANGKVRFYAPHDPRHVSHSIHNLANRGVESVSSFEVESVTLDSLMKANDYEKIDVLKLDIEGAEIEVIGDMLQKQIYPRQVLVEYDELASGGERGKKRIEKTHRDMLEVGYRLGYRERANCTYVLAAKPV